MSDHKRGVPIHLDRERWLFYSISDAKQVWAYSEQEHDPVESMIHVLFIGLRKDDPSLTEEQLSDLVGMHELQMANAKVAEALGSKPEGVSENVTRPLPTSEPTSEN